MRPLKGPWSGFTSGGGRIGRHTSSMQIDQLRSYLDDEAKAASWFRTLGIVDAKRAHANLVDMATAGLTLDLLAVLADQLTEHLPSATDPDRALNNLDRFVAAARSPLS